MAEMNMILTSECEQCNNSVINNEDKAKVTVYCSAKDKTYYWGQCIPCSFRDPKPKQENTT